MADITLCLQTKYKGCCCPDCVDAPRLLRPPKVAGQYGNFSQYAEEGSLLRGEVGLGRC